MNDLVVVITCVRTIDLLYLTLPVLPYGSVDVYKLRRQGL